MFVADEKSCFPYGYAKKRFVIDSSCGVQYSSRAGFDSTDTDDLTDDQSEASSLTGLMSVMVSAPCMLWLLLG